MTQILFLGDGFAQSLCSAYNQTIAPITGASATWRRLIFRPSDFDRQAMEAADRIVVQVASAQMADAVAAIAGSDRCHLFPLVAAPFLWPFGGQAHPANRPLPALPEGPYPAALGDAFLNRLIDAGVDPETAAQRYLQLDVDRAVDLDRMLVLGIAAQRERDRASGYDYADIVAQDFRTVRLFASPEHPSPDFARRICADLLARLDADAAAQAAAALAALDFAAPALPIHPAVTRHFGLSFSHSDADGERAFADHVRLYLAGAALRDRDAAGPSDAGPSDAGPCDAGPCDAGPSDAGLGEAGQRQAAIGRLRKAVARAPGSAPRLMALAKLLAADGQLDAALATARQALQIEPGNIGLQNQTSDFLVAGERIDDAIAILREAVAFDPQLVSRHARLATLLLRARRHDEAETVLRAALPLAPGQADLHDRLGHALAGQRRLAESLEAFLHAAALNPQSAPLQAQLGHMLQRAKRWAEAEAAIRRAIALQPDNARFQEMLAQLLRQRERATPAEIQAETPAAETPAAEAPTAEAPTAETPTAETPAVSAAAPAEVQPAPAGRPAWDVLVAAQTPAPVPSPAPPKRRWWQRLLASG